MRRFLTQVESALKLGQYDHGPAKLRDTRDDERPYSSLSWRDPDLMKFNRVRAESASRNRSLAKSERKKNTKNAPSLLGLKSSSSSTYSKPESPIHHKCDLNSDITRPHTVDSSVENRCLSHDEQIPAYNYHTELDTDDRNCVENDASFDNLVQENSSQQSERDFCSPEPSIDSQECDPMTRSEQSHYIDSYAVSVTPKTFLTDTNANIRPHSAPIKMLQRYGRMAPTRALSPSNSFHKGGRVKQRLNSAPSQRSHHRNHGSHCSTVSVDSTIHKTKCYVPGPHSIDVNNAYSMRGPHSTIYSLLGSQPCPRSISSDVHHKSAWYHVPGRYSTIERPFPSKRSQTRLPTKSSKTSRLRALRIKSGMSNDDESYPHRTETVVKFNEEVLHHSLQH